MDADYLHFRRNRLKPQVDRILPPITAFNKDAFLQRTEGFDQIAGKINIPGELQHNNCLAALKYLQSPGQNGNSIQQEILLLRFTAHALPFT